MPRIKITNPRNVIEAPIKKNYFKIRATSGPKGDKGDTGATGPQGPQGPQGNAATIYVGSTTTLPVGQDATVENVGSQYAAVLNFGIPQGPQGPQGAKGDKGDKGDKGEQGNTGNTGPAGQNATVYIGTTTTGAPGSQASVYNSGTENNAVLNFTIPQGAKGDTGATGATGPQGPAGQDGKDFAPSVVDSLPAVGEENKLYLTPKVHTTQTATGNPITATVTDDAGQIEDFQLDGDTYQQSYTGKNLLNCVQRSGTSQGITCVVSNTNTLTVTGKSTTSYADLTGRVYTNITAGTFTFVVSQALTHRLTVRVYYEGGYDNAIIEPGDTYKTFTMASDITGFYVYMATGGTGITFNETFTVQIVAGSTPDYDYEPFVGGIASPNPSYPQPIQTVTGEQTVSKVGKNLLDLSGTVTDQYLDNTGKYATGSTTEYINQEFVGLPSTQYTFSGTRVGNAYCRLCQYKEDGTFISRIMISGNYTFTTDSECAFIKTSTNNIPTSNLGNAMLELGSTPTTYAPYSKTDYPISLGSIELFKLGTYQDYIWRDGDTWKVHKAINKRRMSSLNWVLSIQASQTRFRTDSINTPSSSGRADYVMSEYFHYNNSANQVGVCFAYLSQLWVIFANNTTTTAEDFSNWIATNNDPYIWHVYSIPPEDTEITDATLISQLNAIASASLENGTNTITNTATGSNLAGDMEVDYFGYDPTNRYDKWLWLDINNAYEKLGS